jgi:hypothetical protein
MTGGDMKGLSTTFVRSTGVWLLLACFSLASMGQADEERKLKAGDRDPEFIARVNDCVRKGAAALKSLQGEEGDFEKSRLGLNNVPYSEGFPGGVTAFVLLTLLKSGVNRNDDAIVKGFRWLRNHQGEGERFHPEGWGTNYVAAVTVLALEALAEPPKNKPARDELTSSRFALRVRMKPRDFKWMQRLVKFLELGVTSSGLEQFVRGTSGKVISGPDAWNYPGGVPTSGDRGTTITATNRWPDHSNTQYALLAFRAAQRCGLRFSPKTAKVMANVVEHFVHFQQKKDPRRAKVQRVTMLEDKKHGYVSYKTVSRELDEPRGWRYIGVANQGLAGGAWQREVTGSMTTAGVACLLISSSIAKRRGLLNPTLLREAKKAVWDGLAWLNVNFTVRKNPGASSNQWLYYYLYGMERAAVLAGVRNIGRHDWYREGAEFILGAQRQGGLWQGDPVPSCFALLFLTRATIPMGTVITHGK